jgi:hypothetical protein
MLLHLNFCIEWFELNSKEDSKSFGKCFEILEKKKKKRKSSPIRFWPSTPARPYSPPQPDRSARAQQRAVISFPRVSLWAEPSQRPGSRAPSLLYRR